MTGLIAFMLNPENYPEETSKVEHKQTHISHVFLTDNFVYKIKKPVNFGFLDFSTLEKRKHFCGEEVKLNSRLSDIYLGVEKIAISKEGSAGFEINGTGKAVEYAVKMKRMPEESIMTNLVLLGKVNEKTIYELAKVIADFHTNEKTSDFLVKNCGMESAKANCDQNFSQTEKYIGTAIDKNKFDYIKNATERFFLGKKELFDARIRKGKIINFHGDLHTGNVFIHKGKIIIFDCIEFNQEFRCGDSVCDLAFMAMDLDYLGREDLSKYLVRKYIEFTGDHLVYALLNFFKCYRAYVRGKVACFMLDDPEISKEQKDEHVRTARKYFWLALEYARRFSKQKPILMISCGLSGTVKSIWLKFATDITGGTLFRTDEVRKKIINNSGNKSQGTKYSKTGNMKIDPSGIKSTKEKHGYGKGEYSEENRQKVYDYIYEKARKILRNGGNVSIDASFIKKENRNKAGKLAKEMDADFVIISTDCPESTAKTRIEKRSRMSDNVSDADFDVVYKKQKEFFEKPADDEPVIMINTKKPVEENLKYLKNKLEKLFIPF